MNVGSIILPMIYFTIFVTGISGNSIFIAAVRKNKKLHSPVFIILANECLSDILFMVTTIFFAVEFLMDEWVFGDVVCRLIGFTSEVYFTVSILSLSVVAIERYVLICRTNKGMKTTSWSLKASGLIWVVSALVCSPLMYGYTAYVHEVVDANITLSTGEQLNYTTIKEEKIRCGTQYWSRLARLVYPCVQAVIIYMSPLLIMLVTHLKIVQILRRKGMSERCSSATNSTNSMNNSSRNNAYSRKITDIETKKSLKRTARNLKIVKLLMTISLTFFVCWSPFIITRILKRFIKISDMTWAVAQSIMVISTTPNFIITMTMSTEFRKTVKSVMKCNPLQVSGSSDSSVRSSDSRDRSAEVVEIEM